MSATTKREPASDEFKDAFRAGIGTSDATCEACNARFVDLRDLRGSDYEAGHIERLQQDIATGKITDVDGGQSLLYVGVHVPWDCKCDTLRKYEDWVWAFRRQISEYLSARTKQELEDAQHNADIASVAATAVKASDTQ